MQRKKVEKLENNLLDRSSSILSIKQMAQLMKLCNFSLEQKWKLLYRASENGFLAEDFHRKCALIRHKILKDPYFYCKFPLMQILFLIYECFRFIP